jgi:ankyrin repeat protein
MEKESSSTDSHVSMIYRPCKLQRGANVNAQNSLGETPIHGAALKANYITIERLIEHGAKVHTCNISLSTPIQRNRVNPSLLCEA